MTSHATGIELAPSSAVMAPPKWRGYCSCGWHGAEHPVPSSRFKAEAQDAARTDALRHAAAGADLEAVTDPASNR